MWSSYSSQTDWNTLVVFLISTADLGHSRLILLSPDQTAPDVYNGTCVKAEPVCLDLITFVIMRQTWSEQTWDGSRRTGVGRRWGLVVSPTTDLMQHWQDVILRHVFTCLRHKHHTPFSFTYYTQSGSPTLENHPPRLTPSTHNLAVQLSKIIRPRLTPSTHNLAVQLSKIIRPRLTPSTFLLLHIKLVAIFILSANKG